MLVPQAVSERNNATQAVKSPLLAMIGANEGSGLYESAEDIDHYIRSLREEWEVNEKGSKLNEQ